MSELSRIFVCMSVSTSLGDSGCCSKLGLTLQYLSLVYQLLHVVLIMVYWKRALIAARNRAGPWLHDFLNARSFVFLQVPCDPGGMPAMV
jgi:hypothetical protein